MIKEIKEPIGALYFNLSDPYQRDEFETCVSSHKYKRFYDELYDEVFRKNVKYNVSFLGEGKECDDKEELLVSIILDKINAFKESL